MFCRRPLRRNIGIQYFLFFVVCMDRGMWRRKACLSVHTNQFFVPICISTAVLSQAYLLSCRFNAASQMLQETSATRCEPISRHAAPARPATSGASPRSFKRCDIACCLCRTASSSRTTESPKSSESMGRHCTEDAKQLQERDLLQRCGDQVPKAATITEKFHRLHYRTFVAQNLHFSEKPEAKCCTHGELVWRR